MAEEIGYVDVSANPPCFCLSEIAPQFPEGKYLEGTDSQWILDPNGRTILFFRKNDREEITEIYSPREKSELTQMILAVKETHPDAHDYISSVMKLPEASAYDIDAFKKNREQTMADQRRLEKAMGETVQYAQYSIDQSRTVGALQGEYAITDANSEKNVIGTFGADPCVMIFIRRPEQENPQTGEQVPARAAIAHFDAMSNIWGLHHFMGKLESQKPLEVTLISGGLDRRTVLRIMDFFAHQNIVLKTDLGNGVRSAVMDVKTGGIIKDVQPLDNGENVDLRMSIAGLKGENSMLQEAYDGTNDDNDLRFSPQEESIESRPVFE